MARNSELRLAIGTNDGQRSTSWKFWASENEVYALHRTAGRIEKLSFHSSRICRRAFVEEHPLPSQLSNRLIQRWKRAKTASAGQGKGVKVLTIIFPTASLSTCVQKSDTKVRCLPAPGPGMATNVQLFFTAEGQPELVEAISSSGRRLEWFYSLPNGENVAIASFVSPWKDKSMIVLGNDTETMDVVLPSMPTPGVDRSVFFSIFTQPDEMVCIEMSGFKLVRGTASLIYPDADTFYRDTAVDRRGAIFG